MTPEEARRILMADADFSGVGEKSEQTADALCVAIDALEKQMPKKRKGQMKYSGRCECGKYIFSDMKFCPNCGQAIDWSE